MRTLAALALALTGCAINDYSDATCSAHFRAAAEAFTRNEMACTDVSKPADLAGRYCTYLVAPEPGGSER